ncbi:MAG: 4-alpha-glucanotransferase [Spirochaetaceae bacterium]|jgi:4-alpha-glucanotransferase|nr:4-alpha-glucanotransferase [Spirochaetaceae bacterium]
MNTEHLLRCRGAGILLAVSSLPSAYGIGSFGESARKWLDFLKQAGQKYWQILPLGPTGWGDSPYQSFSAFAISSYYIDLDALIEQNLLTPAEVASVSWGGQGKVNYAVLYRRREALLKTACTRFTGGPDFEAFCSRNAFWLEDYCLFMTLKKKNKGRSWLEWDEPLRFYRETALADARGQYVEDRYFHAFTQYTAYSQWQGIKAYARSLGIAVIGDMPIYVSGDSADVWAKSGMFQLDRERKPIRAAGCPPDPFAEAGQFWGNPLYRWDAMAERGFDWWISRIRLSLELFDVVRIDHFRGFESFYSIDAAEKDARRGEWVKGPGLAFIEAVHRELPGAAIIAEDLGYLTPEVEALLEASGFPGMKILQFAFDSREASNYMPYTYRRRCVVYTGTHDNPTVIGWFKSAPPEDTRTALDFLGVSRPKEGNWAFIRCALACVADTAIIPMQDYLGLDDRARMNIPSTLGGNNWRWRMLPGAADQALAEKIRRLTARYGRV